MSKTKHKCKCQDSAGNVCNKIMSSREYREDGMCSTCADNVWHEMSCEKNYSWYHNNKED